MIGNAPRTNPAVSIPVTIPEGAKIVGVAMMVGDVKMVGVAKMPVVVVDVAEMVGVVKMASRKALSNPTVGVEKVAACIQPSDDPAFEPCRPNQS